MLGSATITDFELFMDDGTELSSVEEYRLYNKIYHEICDSKDWEFLRKEFSDSLTGTDYVDLPSDFSHVLMNDNYGTTGEYANTPVVYVGTNREVYKIIPKAARYNYTGQDGYCYVDLTNDRITFTKAPSSTTVSFDYQSVPDDVTSSTSPLIPSRFTPMIYHGMCADDFIIQQSDKAKSYRSQNVARYVDYHDAMTMWNSKFTTL